MPANNVCQNAEATSICSAGCHGKILEQLFVQQQQLCHPKLLPSKQQQRRIKQLRVYDTMRYFKSTLPAASHLSLQYQQTRRPGIPRLILDTARSSGGCMLLDPLAMIKGVCSNRLLCNKWGSQHPFCVFILLLLSSSCSCVWSSLGISGQEPRIMHHRPFTEHMYSPSQCCMLPHPPGSPATARVARP